MVFGITFLTEYAMGKWACYLGKFSSGGVLLGLRGCPPYLMSNECHESAMCSGVMLVRMWGTWTHLRIHMEDLGYSVDFPEGKLKAAVLLIHETPDKEMKQLKKR